jgi:hypothetical protein
MTLEVSVERKKDWRDDTKLLFDQNLNSLLISNTTENKGDVLIIYTLLFAQFRLISNI